MTGFASADGVLDDGRAVSATVKSVNGRHLDLVVRLPAGMDGVEAEVRRLVRERVRRGRVELAVTVERAAGGTAVRLDQGLLQGYAEAWRKASKLVHAVEAPELGQLLRMPGVLSVGVAAAEVDEATVLGALRVVGEVLERLDAARAAEGAALVRELRAGMERLDGLAMEARGLREGAGALRLLKLRERVSELGLEVSAERLMAEVALLLERGDVEEELVRLRTHVARFLELLDAGGELGKQLDFLLQELNREANTLLSKTGGEAGLRLTEVGLAMKVEIERAREQVQNLE